MNDSYIVRLPDSNQGSYPNQVVFNNTSSLLNYSDILSIIAESYVELPYMVTITGVQCLKKH